MTTYKPREMGALVARALRAMPVVVLTGLRQTGKTTLLQREPALRARVFFTLDDFATQEAVRQDPDALLRDATVTLDEAHRFPPLLTAIKRAVDRDPTPGRFLLSGSAHFALLKGVSESLAGRAVYLTLEPFTRREIAGTTDATPFLVRFLHEPRLHAQPVPAPLTAGELLRGGMPWVCLRAPADAALWFQGYEQTYLERDLRSLAQIEDLVRLRALLKLAALRTGQILKISELARDAQLTAATAGRYLSLAEISFLVKRLPPFLANRAGRLIKSPKLYFADSGLAAHLAGAGPTDLAPDDPLRGPLLETYTAQNLAGLLGAHCPEARLCFWNVQGRHEVDFVIELGRRCVAIEVKFGGRWTDRDLAGLRSFLACTPHCTAGILAHNGRDAVSLGHRLWAIPLSLLLA